MSGSRRMELLLRAFRQRRNLEVIDDKTWTQ